MRSAAILLAVTLVAGSTTAATAGLLVTVAGQDYDVTTVTTSYNLSTPLLESQVWWTNSALAGLFAGAVNTQLGAPNLGGNTGPYFAADFNNPFSLSNAIWSFPLSTVGFITTGLDAIRTYATATAVAAVPEPATSVVFATGLAAIGGLAARRRLNNLFVGGRSQLMRLRLQLPAELPTVPAT